MSFISKAMSCSQETRGMLAASAAYIIFGFSYLFSKMALNLTEPLILLTARFTLTFLVLNLLVLSGVCRIRLREKRRLLLYPVCIGILQPCLYFVLENYGLSYTTTSFTGMISSLNPVFTSILGAIILREIPNRKQWLFIVISISGVLMVSLDGSGGKNTAAGCICLMAAYLVGAMYSLMIRRYSDDFTPFELTYVMFTVGFLFFTVFTFVMYGGETLPMITTALKQPAFTVPVLYLSAGSSLLAYFLVNYSLARLPVARSTIFGNLATVVSVIAGVIFMNDRFTWVSALAFALILLGIAGVNRFKTPDDIAAQG